MSKELECKLDKLEDDLNQKNSFIRSQEEKSNNRLLEREETHLEGCSCFDHVGLFCTHKLYDRSAKIRGSDPCEGTGATGFATGISDLEIHRTPALLTCDSQKHQTYTLRLKDELEKEKDRRQEAEQRHAEMLLAYANDVKQGKFA